MGCFGIFFCGQQKRYKTLKKQYLKKAQHWLENEDLDEDGDLYCPLSLELFEDPVIAPSGHVFERKVIEQWLEAHQTNPIVTSAKLTPSMLEPFPELLELIVAIKANERSQHL